MSLFLLVVVFLAGALGGVLVMALMAMAGRCSRADERDAMRKTG